MSNLELCIRKEFSKEDVDYNGVLSIREAEMALQRCKQLNLTAFQVQVVLGLSDCDGDGVIQYKEFAAVCAAYIEESYQFDT